MSLLDSQVSANYQKELKAATDRVDQARQAVLGAGSGASQVLLDQYTQAVNALSDLRLNAPHAGYSTIGTTTAAPESATGRVTRAGIGGLLGLMLGLAAALTLARFDTRIRSKGAAEEALGFPVLAEIPLLRRKQRSARAILTHTDPESLAAEAYRGLRTALLVADQQRPRLAMSRGKGPRGASRPSRQSDHKPSNGGRVILVVSPGIGEGKTTTTANLAVAFAESGNSVLALGCDLRRPQLHGYFGMSAKPGLTDLLAQSETQRSLDSVIRATEIPGISVATSGRPIERPGEFLTRAHALIEAARARADVVLIDTAPLLATDDASPLVPFVDEVLVVCRSGRTPVDGARRARDLLVRLQAPVVGVVLIGAQLPGARSYYRSGYAPSAIHRTRRRW